jgi:hypothetical protein
MIGGPAFCLPKLTRMIMIRLFTVPLTVGTG